MTESTRGRGRPTVRVLSPDRIVAAAIALVERGGESALTIAALARELGVAPSALYNHVSGKRELLLLVQDHLIAEIDYAAFAEAPWDEAVVSWARSMREVFARHPQLIPLYAVMPVTESAIVLAMYEAVSDGLLRGGWSEDEAVHAIVTVESFVLGAAMDATAPDDLFDTGALAARFPVFTRVVRAEREAAQRSSRADAAFDLGLQVLVAGLRDRLPT
ncbi:TetR/AcrR family transcriptional regulator [Tsukamurella sp. 8F]|uniref:TetR/AcrR family transcriptional regulator n=1 Tax=unclassified Tsukamurella TaxID=2633480 RepID=UPI0023B9AF83|nr:MULTISPECIES: TetR/AcrR family transcriptional regulator [unclassified Tsukamurella]MDF0530786.1 TetR/AcrR family transcriptional regulator [Tsukamurella sp. 8J]MDF0588312.1 TetR/AcrR family transcriptional regulator [Tsukamurella sp. 8F]